MMDIVFQNILYLPITSAQGLIYCNSLVPLAPLWCHSAQGIMVPVGATDNNILYILGPCSNISTIARVWYLVIGCVGILLWVGSAAPRPG